MVEGYLLSGVLALRGPGHGQNFPKKTKKLTPNYKYLKLGINHRFSVSELLFEH